MWYSERERARLYKPTDVIRFAKSHVMLAEAAHRFAYGLVTLDRETGCYRRACLDSGSETQIINEEKYAERLKAGAVSGPSEWSARRP
jgi:hypothetical protein